MAVSGQFLVAAVNAYRRQARRHGFPTHETNVPTTPQRWFRSSTMTDRLRQVLTDPTAVSTVTADESYRLEAVPERPLPAR